MGQSADADIRLVLAHWRFRGVSPSALKSPLRSRKLYDIRIVIDGHEVVVTDTLVRVFRRAADALRRLP